MLFYVYYRKIVTNLLYTHLHIRPTHTTSSKTKTPTSRSYFEKNPRGIIQPTSLSLSLFLVLPTASLTRKALAPLAILIAIVNIPGAHVWAHTHTYMSRDEKESPLCGKPARECGKGARARAVRLADFG